MTVSSRLLRPTVKVVVAPKTQYNQVTISGNNLKTIQSTYILALK
jgi:hypothetical protein